MGGGSETEQVVGGWIRANSLTRYNMADPDRVGIARGVRGGAGLKLGAGPTASITSPVCRFYLSSLPSLSNEHMSDSKPPTENSGT